MLPHWWKWLISWQLYVTWTFVCSQTALHLSTIEGRVNYSFISSKYIKSYRKGNPFNTTDCIGLVSRVCSSGPSFMQPHDWVNTTLNKLFAMLVTNLLVFYSNFLHNKLITLANFKLEKSLDFSKNLGILFWQQKSIEGNFPIVHAASNR